ncbi:RNA-directed DNA polymerase, eukaryota, reverse transcriptase zinc-binding domain protein [Tanacetum coccineum]
MPLDLTSKGHWTVCAPYGRLVDAFIANKLSKGDSIIHVKLKDIDSMSNMYTICRNEGISDLNIHHVGGYWIWIQFPSSTACSKFQGNESLKRLYSVKKVPSSNFTIDERIFWIEISGLHLCAWGSNAYKKIVCNFGKFLFFDKEDSSALSSGREIGSWSIKINDDYLDTSSNDIIKELDISFESIDDHTVDDLEHIQANLNNIDNQDFDHKMDLNEDNKQGEAFIQQSPKEEVDNKVSNPDRKAEPSDLSRPPGFEFMKKSSSSSSKCSTSFARFRKKDIKGVSLIHELNQIIVVGSSLGYDVRGLVDLSLGGRSFTWRNKAVTKLSKLDRFLILENVIDLLPDIRITAVDRIWSDHNPILLHVEKIDFGQSPFKLYNSWLLRDGFDDLIKSEWELLDSNNTGFPIKCHDKFRILKSKIRQ